MRKCLIKLLSLALFSTAIGSGNLPGKMECPRDKVIEVKEGGLGYSAGPIVSHNFFDCSAVILDFGNEALMAHAYSNSSALHGSRQYVGYDSVVEELLSEAEKRHLDLSHAKVRVVFRHDSRKNEILHKLRDYHLAIEEIIDSEITPRSVYFNPLSDTLLVESSSSSLMRNMP